MTDRPLQRSAGVVFDMAGDRAVLLDGTGSELITLNAIGSIVWNMLDGVRSADELAALLVDRFDDVELAQLRDDIATFLDELLALGVAEDGQP